MKKERVISILLIAVMVFAAAVSCAKPGVSDETTTADDIPAVQGKYHADYLPDDKYDGYEFRLISIESSLPTQFDCDITENTPVLAAQYKRNRNIEARRDIKFKESSNANYEDIMLQLKSMCNSGDHDYDLEMLVQRNAFSVAINGYLTPVEDMKYMHTDEDWYVKDVNEDFVINGKMYFAYTAECLNMFAQSNCIIFNQSIVDDMKLDSPYDLIDRDAWTLENFLRTAEAATSDIDNDGEVEEDENIGIVGEGDMLYPTIWIGCGAKAITNNGDDLPKANYIGNETLIDILDTFQELYTDRMTLFDTAQRKTDKIIETDDQRERAAKVFMNGNALYRTTVINNIQSMSGIMDDDFGVVPAPKYDDKQTKYIARVIDGWIYVVPNTCSDTDMTSIILEELAVESMNYVYDAYYQTALKDRYSRDDKTKEMLDLISESRGIDLGDTIWQADCRNSLLGNIWNGETKFATLFSSSEKYMDQLINVTFNPRR